MNIQATETIRIEDGKHLGKIVAVDERTKPYHYIDFVIESDVKKQDGSAVRLKYGVPAIITKESQLAKLMRDFGAGDIVVGQSYDPETLKGRDVEFMTLNETSERGTFANIVKNSLKPR